MLACLPSDRVLRAHCRSICGEIHSGFTTLRAVAAGQSEGSFSRLQDMVAAAQADIDRGLHDLARVAYAKFGRPLPVRRSAPWADAMYAPVGDALHGPMERKGLEA